MRAARPAAGAEPVNDWLNYVFEAAAFVPHGYCLLWRPDLVAMHAVSDAVIAGSYFSIPISIAMVVRGRQDLSLTQQRVGGLFIAFIIACGLTHVGNAATLWFPYYGALGIVKSVTAIVSLATAVILMPIVPRLIAMPSRAELEATNARLAREVEAHRATTAELLRVKAELEDRVAERTAEVARNAEQVALIADAVPAAIGYVDEGETYRFANAGYRTLLGVDPEAVRGERMATVLGPEAYAAARPAIQRALAGEPADAELRRRVGDAEREFAAAYRPHLVGGRSVGFFALLVDVTERKRTEERLRLLILELNHRVKNVMAVTQAVVSQTLRGPGPVKEARDALRGRLHALGAAIDALNQTDWRGADLAELARANLTALDGRVEFDGPALTVGPRAAQTLSLLLYELASNAAKHGLLAAAEGRARLSWRAEGERFRLEWRETGGAAPEGEPRHGFGLSLLGRVAPRELGGRASWRFEDGFRYELDAPLAALTGLQGYNVFPSGEALPSVA
jgi:PAS domain S-box-containing protein